MKHKNPLITVIVPVYKRFDLATEAIDSVFKQTIYNEEKIEVLVIKEKMEPEAMGSKIKKLFPKTKIFTNADKEGPGGKRNTGLKHAKGKYIAFLDSDDVWEKDFLKYSIDILDKFNGTTATVSLSHPIFEKFPLKDKVLITSFNIIKDLVLYPIIIFKDGNLPKSGFYLLQISHVVFRKSVIKNVKFDYKFRRGGEDWDIFSKVLSKGPIRIVPKQLVNFRYHWGSSTTLEVNQMLKWRSYQKLVEGLPEDFKTGILYKLFIIYMKLRGGSNVFPRNKSKFEKLILYGLSAGIQLPFLFNNWYEVIYRFLGLKPDKKEFSLSLKTGHKFHLMHFLDSLMFYEIWKEDVYRLNKMKNPKVILDIGSNIGSFSIKAAIDFPTARVIAIEPSVETFLLLKKNIKENSIHNIESINKAIFGKNGYHTLYDPGPGGLRSLYPPSKKRSAIIRVETTTLEKIISRKKIKYIDLLKMDCEGSEYNIFENLSSELFLKIKVISMEYHDGNYGHHSQLVEKFHQNGFHVELASHPIETNIGYIYATRGV